MRGIIREREELQRKGRKAYLKFYWASNRKKKIEGIRAKDRALQEKGGKAVLKFYRPWEKLKKVLPERKKHWHIGKSTGTSFKILQTFRKRKQEEIMKRQAIQLKATYFNCKPSIFNHVSTFSNMISCFFNHISSFLYMNSFLEHLSFATTSDKFRHLKACCDKIGTSSKSIVINWNK